MRLSRTHSTYDVVEITPVLFVGSAPGRTVRAILHRRGVRHVLDLRAERVAPSQWPQGVDVRFAPVADGSAPDLDELDELTRWVLERANRGEPVLIYCHAGIGRAATVACAALMRIGYTLPEAHRLVRERRPVINPTDTQLTILRAYETRLRP